MENKDKLELELPRRIPVEGEVKLVMNKFSSFHEELFTGKHEIYGKFTISRAMAGHTLYVFLHDVKDVSRAKLHFYSLHLSMDDLVQRIFAAIEKRNPQEAK